MKILIALLILSSLSGCATPPRFIANYYNSQDPCQSYGKPQGWQRPDWCYTNNNSYLVTTQRLGPGAARITVIK